MVWRVRTASRLHFGLLSLAQEGERWPDRQGELSLPARRFGSVGLMVADPGLQLRVEPASTWSVEPEHGLGRRALDFAQRFLSRLQAEDPTREWPARRLVLEAEAPEHVGLGTGTQLGLAVARALAASWGLNLTAAQLAERVGRGARSGLGIHGFEQGGFLVDGGRGSPWMARGQGIAPLLARVPFPEDWRVVLAWPTGLSGLHGAGEQQAFAHLLGRGAVRVTEGLCRLVLLGLLPALIEADLQAFGSALYDFNARVGEAFASEQGGIYAGLQVAALVSFLRQQGVTGVGQSSWGPAVFGVVGDPDQGEELARRVRSYLGPDGIVWLTRGANHGAESSPPGSLLV